MFTTHLPGIVVALFFQCVGVLLSPVNSMGRGPKWILVAHTVALFSFLTMAFGIGLNELSIIYINYREFRVNTEVVSGPLGYKGHLITDAGSLLLNVMFPLNQWLADGLLVCPVSNLVAYVFNVGWSSSCIVAILFIP